MCGARGRDLPAAACLRLPAAACYCLYLRPIANKYHEGKVKRTLNRELKAPEIAEREANGTSASWQAPAATATHVEDPLASGSNRARKAISGANEIRVCCLCHSLNYILKT